MRAAALLHVPLRGDELRNQVGELFGAERSGLGGSVPILAAHLHERARAHSNDARALERARLRVHHGEGDDAQPAAADRSAAVPADGAAPGIIMPIHLKE